MLVASNPNCGGETWVQFPDWLKLILVLFLI